MSEVTRILSRLDAGETAAADQLLPLVYEELRNLAAAKLAQEKPGQTLQPTALVHEAYLRLAGSREQGTGNRGQGTGDREQGTTFHSRAHFFAAAAEAMRRILVDAARRKQTQKRGGGAKRVELDVADPLVIDETLDLVALDEALTRFAAQEPLKAQLVKLRFFAGLTMQQAADALEISLATAERHWTFARTWLFAELSGEESARKSSEKRPDK